MIIAISAGREGSKGFPGKNTFKLGAHPMLAYPIMAAVNCRLVDCVMFTSDSEVMDKIAESYGVNLNLSRPKELATDKALLEDVYVWAYKERIQPSIEFVVLLMSNAPCITSKMMEEMILILRENEEADSICTVSKYNMFHPNRSRKFVDKYLVPYVPECIDGLTTCDRDCSDDSYIYDCSCAVVRPYCLEKIEEGLPPQKWLGQKILGYKQRTPAIDIDYAWQVGQLQYWLQENW